ncbi:hypothetical protein TcasGA2_TC012759 [Tribolium castaneum]|uniref:Uncharacterized protein n=1 Tax=Tribolium castaneum TaxID=7070 RepID=D6X015_TRICA|nr:hypothetical protein TcasGA2_TC012759 [Tribolium castaneum]
MFRVLSLVLLLVYVADSRSIDTKNYYQLSTTDEAKPEEYVFFTNDGLLQVELQQIDQEVPSATPKREKTRCIGPATLMALCF